MVRTWSLNISQFAGDLEQAIDVSKFLTWIPNKNLSYGKNLIEKDIIPFEERQLLFFIFFKEDFIH